VPIVAEDSITGDDAPVESAMDGERPAEIAAVSESCSDDGD
jgi:hypothetical protein